MALREFTGVPPHRWYTCAGHLAQSGKCLASREQGPGGEGRKRQIEMHRLYGILAIVLAMAFCAASEAEAALVDMKHTAGGGDRPYNALMRDRSVPWTYLTEAVHHRPDRFLGGGDDRQTRGNVAGHLLHHPGSDGRKMMLIWDQLGDIRVPQFVWLDPASTGLKALPLRGEPGPVPRPLVDGPGSLMSGGARLADLPLPTPPASDDDNPLTPSTPTPIPEPTTLAPCLAIGAMLLMLRRRGLA